jgi:hypothetical protein
VVPLVTWTGALAPAGIIDRYRIAGARMMRPAGRRDASSCPAVIGGRLPAHGQATGFVPPLDRLAVRHISGRFLSQDERIEIADLRHAGLSIRQIALRSVPWGSGACPVRCPCGVTLRGTMTHS